MSPKLGEGTPFGIDKLADRPTAKTSMSMNEVLGRLRHYIRIAARDTRDYERLLREKLHKIPGIRHSKSNFVLRVLKEASIPL